MHYFLKHWKSRRVTSTVESAKTKNVSKKFIQLLQFTFQPWNDVQIDEIKS